MSCFALRINSDTEPAGNLFDYLSLNKRSDVLQLNVSTTRPPLDTSAVRVCRHHRRDRALSPQLDQTLLTRSFDRCEPNIANPHEIPVEILLRVLPVSWAYFLVESRPISRRSLLSGSGRPFLDFARSRAASKRRAFLGDLNKWAVSSRLESSLAASSATSSAPRRLIMMTSRSSIALLHRVAKLARAAV